MWRLMRGAATTWLIGMAIISVCLSSAGIFVCANFIVLNDGSQYRVFMRTISSPKVEVSYPFEFMADGIYRAEILASSDSNSVQLLSDSTVEFEGSLFHGAAKSLASGAVIEDSCLAQMGGSSSLNSGRKVLRALCDVPFSSLVSNLFGSGSIPSEAVLSVYAGNRLFLGRNEGITPDSELSREQFEAKYHRQRSVDEQVSVAASAGGSVVKSLASASYLLEGFISSASRGYFSAPSYFHDVTNHDFVIKKGQKISIYYETSNAGLVGISFLK